MRDVCRSAGIKGEEKELLDPIIKHEANAKCKQGIEQEAQEIVPLLPPMIQRV